MFFSSEIWGAYFRNDISVLHKDLSIPERVVEDPGLAGDIVLCSLTKTLYCYSASLHSGV